MYLSMMLIKPVLLAGCFCMVFWQHGHTQTLTDSASERSVNIGYHQLFIHIKGPEQARFTIVFESGGGGTSKDWAKVIALLPPDLRTVSYDRAGLGKSGHGPLPRTMVQEVLELHQLLQNAGIKGQIILVGSLSAASTQGFTHNDTAGRWPG